MMSVTDKLLSYDGFPDILCDVCGYTHTITMMKILASRKKEKIGVAFQYKCPAIKQNESIVKVVDPVQVIVTDDIPELEGIL